MVGNPYRWRAAVPQLENRNATAGCLLSLLFVAPYLAHHGILGGLTLGLAVLFYVALVVPLLTGILSSKTLITFARRIAVAVFHLEQWQFLGHQIVFLLGWAHSVYLQLDGIHITVMQVVFNMAAEKVLCPEQRLCSLYVLLFYSVLAYLQRALQARPWAHLLNESSTAEFLKLTTAFIIVRLGKGVAMSLVLLTFTLQFNSMEPSFTFVFVTFFYFFITQYQGQPLVTLVATQWLKKAQLSCLEDMEELWAPLFLSTTMVGMAVVVAALCILTTNSYVVFLILSYSNIAAPFLLLCKDQWSCLQMEKSTISRFPLASWKNPEILSGGLCAICLDKLCVLSARVTMCGHVFHGPCLRLCLKYSSTCPLCKSPI